MTENRTYSIPPWIASRSYFTGTEKARTIITNSTWFMHLILEETSSDLWSILPRKFTIGELRPMLPTVNIDPEDGDNLNAVADFLETLRADGVVQVEGEDNPKPPPMKKVNVAELAGKTRFSEALEKEGLLPSSMVELTYRCSAKCVHCFNPRQQYDASNDLTTQEVIKLIDDLYEVGVYEIAFSGGEASLRKDIFEILDECRRLSITFQIFSNGLIPKEKVQRLISYYPHTIGVSIYSANPDIHDVTTQVKGSWKKSIETVKILVAAGIRVVLKNPIMQHTVHGYKAFLKLCDELGAVAQCSINLTPTTDGDQQVYRHLVTNINDLTQLFSDPQLTLGIDINEPSGGQTARSGNTPPCNAGITFLGITPNGTVYPCVCLPITLGNVREQSVVDIWKHSKPLAAWQSVVLNDFNECHLYPECLFCDLCPGKALLETGDTLGVAKTSCHAAKVKQDVAKQLAMRLNPATSETFGYDLSFREPATILSEPNTRYSAHTSVDHNGENFVERIENIKKNGNSVRKAIMPTAIR